MTQNRTQFFEITKPLSGTRYKKDPLLPEETQKMPIEFKTNISYDSVQIWINGEKTKEWINITRLSPGEHRVKVELIQK